MWEDEFDDYGYGSAKTYTPYTTSYGRAAKKSNSWSRSSWSNYSFFTSYADNDDDLIVKDPVSYITPTKAEIKKKVKVFKQEGIDFIKELARVCYFKMIEEKDYLSEELSDWDNLDDDTKAKHSMKKEIYDSIYDKFIPGYTPLEQAVAIFLEMQNKQKEYDEDGDLIERDEDHMSPSFGFNRELYSDPTINEQLEYNELSKDRKMEIMNKISIIGDLGTQFKVEKEVDEKIVANSPEHRRRAMKDHSQLPMIDLYQRMLPHYRVKFLTKDLTVNVPVERKEQKQKIIILLDFSGSMDYDEKQIWVNALLIDRFRYVMKGEAEVFFSYFVSDTEELKFFHIKDREDVLNFWSWFSNDPNGGTTRIGDMVEYVSKQIINEKRLHNLDIDLSEEKPEILIINDGQDSVNVDKFPYKVNAVSLMEFSDELKNLCVATGGKQVKVEEDNIITAYSTQGEQIISR